ncbi:MAG TPA: hypothetical protein VMY37_01310 [Thermoguttaceae bacterium]|nr:hypothetical protein [Thermoguttaceae bacterium]
MKLDLGGIDAIDNPTADDIHHYLKFMPTESPFVVLSNGDQFIQSVYQGSDYRVEYKSDDGTQFFATTDYETAVKLFVSFLARDGNYRSAVAWKRLRLSAWTTPNHPCAVSALCVLLIIGIVIAIWSALN